MTSGKLCPVLTGALSLGLAFLATSCHTYPAFFSANETIDGKNEAAQPKRKFWRSYRNSNPEAEGKVYTSAIDESEMDEDHEAVLREVAEQSTAPIETVPEKTELIEVTNNLPVLEQVLAMKPVENPSPKRPTSPPEIAAAKQKPNKKDDSPNMVDDLKVALTAASEDNADQPATPGKTIKVRADSIVRIINADGEDIIVTGKEGVVIIKGKCRILTLSGNNNRVTCDQADKIALTGSENTLVSKIVSEGYISGNRNELSWMNSLDGKVPNLVSTGSYNNISRIK